MAHFHHRPLVLPVGLLAGYRYGHHVPQHQQLARATVAACRHCRGEFCDMRDSIFGGAQHWPIFRQHRGERTGVRTEKHSICHLGVECLHQSPRRRRPRLLHHLAKRHQQPRTLPPPQKSLTNKANTSMSML